MKRRADRSVAVNAVPALATTIPTRMVGNIRPLFGIYEVSVIYGISVPSIRRGLQAGTFRPLPWDKYPYRWNPEDIEKDLATPRDLRMRKHGRYGEHRLRSAKVESPHNGRRSHKKHSR